MYEFILLTQPSCSYCNHAKEILARLAHEYPLRVTEIDMQTEEGGRLAIKHAVIFAPGILRGGRLFSYGRLSEKKLRAQLGREDTKL